MAITVVMQSSHATLVLIITALATAQITYENALALSIGANVGTTITAILGSLSANIAGKRLAGAHLIFNVFTAVVAIIFIKYLLVSVDWIGDYLKLASDNYTLRLAIFHTLFNVIGVVLMAPFIQPLVRLLEWALPEKQLELKTPKYLSDSVLESSQATLAAVRSESVRLFDLSIKVLANGIGLRKKELTETVTKTSLVEHTKPLEDKDINDDYENRIKHIYSAIVEFVANAREKFSGKYGKAMHNYSSAVQELAQAIKEIKHMQKNLFRFIKSNNEDIKQEYNKLRWLIISTIREIDLIQNQDTRAQRKQMFDDGFNKVEKHGQQMVKNIENLIRSQAITAEMGTSLITDSEYCHRACVNLIQMAKKLFIKKININPEDGEFISL
jgi:phosphate:Na+ symporter